MNTRNLQFIKNRTIAQLVKNLPAMQETLVRFLDWEDPLEDAWLLQKLNTDGLILGKLAF